MCGKKNRKNTKREKLNVPTTFAPPPQTINEKSLQAAREIREESHGWKELASQGEIGMNSDRKKNYISKHTAFLHTQIYATSKRPKQRKKINKTNVR